MLVTFNLVILLLIGVIAYWWANQGLFSALLHLLCVITAGAVALGLWEPVVVGLLLKGGGFDDYAWGLTLVGIFVVTLLILRVIADKTCPANVDLPRWANMSFGFPVGAASGILTIGIVLIGMGFTQSSAEIMGYRGYGRDVRDGKVVKYPGSLWVPAPLLTSEFYGWLSVTSMWTPSSMRHLDPALHMQATLLRDSFNNGKGALAMAPGAATIESLNWQPGGTEAAVTVSFLASALDFGEQLTLSASQVRLLSDARGTGKARVAYPSRWVQDGTLYEFDNVSHYVTSTPGRESTEATLVFDSLPTNFTPRYIQIKGLRFRLPGAEPLPADLATLGGGATGRVEVPAPEKGAEAIPAEDLMVSNDIRPLRVGVNGVPGTMTVQDNYFVEGDATWSGKPSQVSRALQIKGVLEPTGTRIVKLDVSRGHAADLFRGSLRQEVPENASIALVDDQGNTYSPLGYILRKVRGEIAIKLAPGKFLRQLSDLPYLPTSGAEELRLYFRVTEKAHIVGLLVDGKMIATADLSVPMK